MRAFEILLACPSIALAAMIPRQGLSAPPGPWLAGLWHVAEDTTIWGTPISASGGKFWLGKDSSTYCPSGVENLDCSVYTQTRAAFVGGNGTVSMNVAVPGGQQVYIAPDGALAYTPPHSAALPDGAITTGFGRETSQAGGAPVGLYFLGRSWMACPIGNSTAKVYQIYLSDSPKSGCYGGDMRTYTNGISAWEYL